MLVKQSFMGKLELKFFPQREFQPVAPGTFAQQAPVIARNALRFLMMGWTNSCAELVTWPVLSAVFFRRNPELLRQMRMAFQEGFEYLFEQLKGKDEHEQTRLYLSNCLALLPYSDLTPYESIKIPQYIQVGEKPVKEWILVEYRVVPIEISDSSGFKRYFIRDQDRVFAYGLEPLFQENAQSHLIFMGTTYPAGQGLLTQLRADLNGFATVGLSLYLSGRERIHQWLSCQKNKVHVCGVSLGGSLSLLLALDRGYYSLSVVDALNPAGLHDNQFQATDIESAGCQYNKPRVVVQKQGNDPVSIFGLWKSDWEIIEVRPPVNKQGINRLFDHFLNYAGFNGTTFRYINPDQDNARRKIRNLWIYSLGRAFIYYSIVLPYSFVVRPTLYFIADNWELAAGCAIFLGITGLMLSGFLPFSLFLISGIALATAIVCAVISLSLQEKKPETVVEQTIDNLAEMHKPNLPRNETMDMYHSSNMIEQNLKSEDINTYYKITRCLIKQKAFIPGDEKPSKHCEGISKKALLIASEDPQQAKTLIPFRMTKAKAAHVTHSLSLIHKLGKENELHLKSELEKKLVEYQVGKQVPVSVN